MRDMKSNVGNSERARMKKRKILTGRREDAGKGKGKKIETYLLAQLALVHSFQDLIQSKPLV
jgi:hypothetical protein